MNLLGGDSKMFDLNIMNNFKARFGRGIYEYYKLEFENNT